MMKSLKAGFTLAEVLVTLMVIGVVAAMTIPTLMTNTGDKQDQVAVKKVASVLSQGVQLLVAKEVSCTKSAAKTLEDNSAALATCMGNVISGNISGHKMTTNDGMILYFYAPSTSTWTGITSCGSGAMRGDVTGWNGAGNCAVVADINGTAKGTKETYTEQSTYTSAGFASNPQVGTDIVAFSLSADSVRPMYFSSGVNPAYKAIYGAEPASPGDVYGDRVYCAKSATASDNYGDETAKTKCGGVACAIKDQWELETESTCTTATLAAGVPFCEDCGK